MVFRTRTYCRGVLRPAYDGHARSRGFQECARHTCFRPATSSRLDVHIDAKTFWTGDPDAHLRSADFLDVEHYPEITFKGDQVEILGDHDYILTGELTIRGVMRTVPLKVRYLGQRQTPWWEGNVDKGPKTRAGFLAETTINQHDFGVSWNSPLDKGGIVVGSEVEITIDAEAILEKP